MHFTVSFKFSEFFFLSWDCARLKNDIADKVEGQACQVLVARHVQVGGEALDAGVADVAAVEERQQVQDAHSRQQPPVELAEQGPLVDAVEAKLVWLRRRGRIRVTPMLDIVWRRLGARF